MLTQINGGTGEVNRTVGGNALIEGSVVSGAVVNPLTAGGSITAVAAVDSHHVENSVFTSTIRWQGTDSSGHITQTLHMPEIHGSIPAGLSAYQGAGGVSVQLPKDADVRTTIEAISKEPGKEYLTALANRSDVDWQRVEVLNRSLDFSQSGLTKEAAIVVAVVVSILTYGAASGWGAAAANATNSAAVGAAVTAGTTSLASTAAVSLINNKGDIGAVLSELGSKDNAKGLLLTMATAGVSQGILSQIPVSGGGTLAGVNAASSWSDLLGKNIVQGLTSSVLESAVLGTSSEDSIKANLQSALVNTVGAKGANAIGDGASNGSLNDTSKAIAHALLGCAIGTVTSGNGAGCAPGATGAVVGELVASWYGSSQNLGRLEEQLKGDPTNAALQQQVDQVRTTVADLGKLAGAGGALLLGGDAAAMQIAMVTGSNAAVNNYLNHTESLRLTELQKQKEAGTCGSACDAEIASLKAQDAARNQELKDCVGNTTTSCEGARQDLRNAAAEYIRKEEVRNTRGDIYAWDYIETTQLAYASINGKATGAWQAVKDMASDAIGGIVTAFNAKNGDLQAINQLVASSKAVTEFLSDAGNLPYLVGFMSPTQREVFAVAVESNDGKTVGKMLTDQTFALAGAITTVGGVAKATTLTASILKDVALAKKANDVLSNAVYVIPGVPPKFGEAGAITSGVYRIETVTPEMRAAYKGAGYLDPRDNVFKSAPAGEAMAVDHIYPSNAIVNLPGFDQLTKQQMTNILQDKIGLGNLQPLPTSLNASKGAQLGWPSGYKDVPINFNYLQALKDKQSFIEVKINNQIKSYLQANKVGAK